MTDKSSVAGVAVSSHVESLIKKQNYPHTLSSNKRCYIMATFRGHYVLDKNVVFVYQTLLTVNIARGIFLGASLSTTAGPPMTDAGNSMLKKPCMLLFATPPNT